jgi:hypothetical protein
MYYHLKPRTPPPTAVSVRQLLNPPAGHSMCSASVSLGRGGGIRWRWRLEEVLDRFAGEPMGAGYANTIRHEHLLLGDHERAAGIGGRTSRRFLGR